MDITKALQIIEMNSNELSKINSAKNFQEAQNIFNDFKTKVEKQRKKLALKYHPDKGGSVEKMQEINNIIDEILALEIKPIVPRPMVNIVIHHYSSGSSSTTTTGWW